MSTPTTHDPLVVNTKDGAVWMRRAVTREGRGLYAVTDAPKCCPEFVMATLTELAEHGIAGSADALPMPVGPKPLALTEQQIDALAAAGNRVVNDAVHQDLCMCDAWPEKCISTGAYFMGAWDVSGLETALPAVIALWESMRSDVLTELLRTAEAYAAQLEGRLREIEKTPFSLGEDPIAYELTPGAKAADKLTRLFAPVQALREDEAAEEKASVPAPTATPGPTGRVGQLLDAIRTDPGTWTTNKAFEIYRLLPAHAGMPLGQIRTFARGDLRDLAAWGHLTASETSGRREYHLNTRKGGNA